MGEKKAEISKKGTKSLRNIRLYFDLVQLFGVDAVRYYVLHEIPFAADGNLTYELVCEKSNSDLANTLGNLVNRTMAMGKKYFGGTVVKGASTEFDANLESLMESTVVEYKKCMDNFRVADGIEAVLKLLRASNKYIDETAPWALSKDETKKDVLMGVLYHLFESIRISASLLEPIMPTTSKSIYNQINTELSSFNDLAYGLHSEYVLNEASVLFKRLDVNKDVLDIVLAKESKKEEPKKPVKPAKPEISIDDFDKVELVVGKILDAKKHPKAYKLLVFKVDIGTEVRQIVSGIAKFYKPEELIGKKVVVVKNLKPIKLRGEDSCGMLLCAANDEDSMLELLNVDKLNPGDSVQ